MDTAFFACLSKALGKRPGFPKRLAELGQLDKEHPKVPHWYLFALGTRPEARGKGYASAVISAVTTRCDKTQTPAYLENSNPLNTPLYEKHGFKVTKTLYMGENKVPVALMWRDPKPIV